MPYIYMEKNGICMLAASKVCVWDKPSSGDKFAPYKHPEDHLDAVYFHSDFDYYALHSRAAVIVTHQAVAGLSIVDARGYGANASISQGQTLVQEQVLVTHNLGYVPRFKVAQGGRELPSGMNVQNPAGQGRLVSFYATATQIIVRNSGSSNASTLPAVTVDYDVLVFKDPTVTDSLPLFQLKPGRAIMGRGKIDTNIKTMRVGTVADSPFFISLGRTIDINSGASRVVVPGGAAITQSGYGGSFAGSPNLRTFV